MLGQKTPVLVCTVGGSHAPVVTAIRTHQPAFVWFICTTGKAGSDGQIRGKGSCIKKSPKDETPSLPSIPTQTKLLDDQFDVLIVPPDDLDAIHGKLRELFGELTSAHPETPIIADFTGGTKSMTAALILAGLEFEKQVELYMVAGQRADLVQVTDGTEIPLPANVDRIRFLHKFNVAMAPWSYFGYGEAAVALETMRQPRDASDRQKYLNALAASRAFAAWDRFDHSEAQRLLQPLGNRFGQYLATLSQLTAHSEKQTPVRLLDLLLNMRRRARRRQYDDAVARAYRLLEWTAQWLLQRDAGFDTTKVPQDRIPEGMDLPRNEKGDYVAGLRNAWTLLETHGSESIRNFAASRGKEMQSLLTVRNHSILAHGFQPISETEWNSWQAWIDDSFFPLLQAETQNAGIKRIPEQLPLRMPDHAV